MRRTTFLVLFGVVFGLCIFFIILATCGMFHSKLTIDWNPLSLENEQGNMVSSATMNDTTESGIWIEEPDTLSGVAFAIRHRLLLDEEDGFNRVFQSRDFRDFYYNERHGYFVLLPTGMGYNQRGEHIIGGHSNVFNNQDSSVVIVCSALFYDVVIIDNPDYEDTMRSDHIEWLKSMGQVSFLLDKLDNIIAKVKINRSNPGNPPSDFLLSKWLLKKDIDDRECEMYLDIWYNENLQLREGEFRNIIDKFPDNPF